MYALFGDLQDFLDKKCQKKTLKIMNFAPFKPLFKNCNILKFADIINVQSSTFINNYFSRDSFSIFNENFNNAFIQY